MCVPQFHMGRFILKATILEKLTYTCTVTWLIIVVVWICVCCKAHVWPVILKTMVLAWTSRKWLGPGSETLSKKINPLRNRPKWALPPWMGIMYKPRNLQYLVWEPLKNKELMKMWEQLSGDEGGSLTMETECLKQKHLKINFNLHFIPHKISFKLNCISKCKI